MAAPSFGDSCRLMLKHQFEPKLIDDDIVEVGQSRLRHTTVGDAFEQRELEVLLRDVSSLNSGHVAHHVVTTHRHIAALDETLSEVVKELLEAVGLVTQLEREVVRNLFRVDVGDEDADFSLGEISKSLDIRAGPAVSSNCHNKKYSSLSVAVSVRWLQILII